jgi:NAD(P)-dependent dehydrogenase (short-subunit alcohol dehydrogenase family)
MLLLRSLKQLIIPIHNIERINKEGEMRADRKKTVLITGSSTGIGRETALYFHEQGWRVIATMRHPEQRRTALHDVKEIRLLHLDVLDDDSIHKAVQATVKEYGRLDVLVNNAGYAVVGSFEAATKMQIERQFSTNVLGLMAVTKEAIPVFRSQQGGVIVNIASIGGRITFPLFSLYHGTKWAVEGFSESLQYELRPFNIRVKIVEPGLIKTDFYEGSMDYTKGDSSSFYERFTERVFKNINQTVASGSHPLVVARTIFEAATDGSYRLRYSIGRNAKPLLALRRLLPEGLYVNIVRLATTR